MAIPKTLTGESLLSCAKGGNPPKRDAVYGEIYLHTAQSLSNTPLNLTHRWMRKGDWKLILKEGRGSVAELYHLAWDPGEENNLAGQMPGKVEELKQAVLGWTSAHSQF